MMSHVSGIVRVHRDVPDGMHHARHNAGARHAGGDEQKESPLAGAKLVVGRTGMLVVLLSQRPVVCCASMRFLSSNAYANY